MADNMRDLATHTTTRPAKGSVADVDPGVRHPAVYSDAVLDVMRELLDEYMVAGHRFPETMEVLDPFAGTGKIHQLPYRTKGVELEPEWANMHPFTLVGDATQLPRDWTNRFAAVVTSPCYGNRMADHHEAHDACSECDGAGHLTTWPHTTCNKCKGSGLSPRRSYRHDLGRMPSEGSSAVLHFGAAYKDLHAKAWREVHRVLRHGGIFLLNVKDFIRDGEIVRVCDWHRRACGKLGFERLETVTVPTPGMRHGQNHEARVPAERVYVFRRA